MYTKRRIRAAAVGAALTLFAVSGDAAHAAGASRTVEGLHVSAGGLVDPAGRIWVSDHNGGFCRTTPATDDGPGQIEHPQRAGAPGARTCLGGLLPDAGPGPDAAGQPVLVDPTPDRKGNGDELALIPDGASPSSDVVRARWNPNTKLFAFQDTITMSGARGRPTALALGPDDAVYVGFQREGTVQRILDPAGVEPDRRDLGQHDRRQGGPDIAVGADADGEPVVYVGEAGGLQVLRPGSAR